MVTIGQHGVCFYLGGGLLPIRVGSLPGGAGFRVLPGGAKMNETIRVASFYPGGHP